jgi:hypothetical protein
MTTSTNELERRTPSDPDATGILLSFAREVLDARAPEERPDH